jgi:hypothetical protein
MSHLDNICVRQVLKTLCILAKPAGASALRFAVVMIGDMFLDMAKCGSPTPTSDLCVFCRWYLTPSSEWRQPWDSVAGACSLRPRPLFCSCLAIGSNIVIAFMRASPGTLF